MSYGVRVLACLALAAWMFAFGVWMGRRHERAEAPNVGVFRVMDDGQIVAQWVVPAGGGVEVRAVDLPKSRPLTLPPHHCGEGE